VNCAAREGPLEEKVLWRRRSSGGEGPLEERVRVTIKTY